ncbi:protein IMPACT-like [Anthonomus grandis grandis]|uniref:protein IMPACT-like n=1 Tax=Anthonomus grandis grandis TaxID=2921223 RepID=UPI0021659615|nr:protein IMPACT-like [Anthonomus grandis grandis]XP_050311807.1 protein IMPACT-like [Anthonomus grandis grandis]XP_050311808.1 protein IMPACT-like [Anthonomus grandis grandis]
MSDNYTQQMEELEVLDSIFGDQWEKRCVDETYGIKLAKDVELMVTLNKDYPSDRAPTYDLWAPHMSKSQKDLIHKEFMEIFENNKGYPIIYQWIMNLKDMAQECSTKKSPELSKKNKESESTKRDIQIESSLKIIHGPTITDRKSTFQGHAALITHRDQVKEFLDTLKQNKKISQAKHNVSAYRLLEKKGGKQTLLQDCDDDGENHAGGRLMHLLTIADVKNVMVVVTRWYGGIQLGNDRFKHYNNAARQAMLEGGFI